MQRLDQNIISNDLNDILVFTVMRNEYKRLSYWLQYYREQGVSQFFIVDNGSSDGSVEFLLQQNDVILFQTTESFAAASYGTNWMNDLLDQYGTGRWCFFVDLDELFVFSKSLGDKLPDLITHMNSEGAEGVFAIMVDMYSPSSLKQVAYQPGTSFLTQCNAFDAKPYFALPVSQCPNINVVGGVRQRLFYPEFSRRSLADRIGWKLGALLKKLPFLSGQQWVKNMIFTKPPVISKVPLVKWKSGRHYISNAHTIASLKLFSARCALLHFKFFEDFHAKALEEIKRNQHYDGAREYRRYFSFFSKNPDFSFKNENTNFYETPDSLEKVGIITGAGSSYPTHLTNL